LVAELPRYAGFASKIAPLANLRNRSTLLRRLGERFLGIAAARPLPAFRSDPFRDAEIGQPTGATGEVILFGDTFNRAYEPENLRAAVRVLRKLGLTPVMPKVTGRPLCCGRTYLAAGLVDKARAEAKRTMEALAGDALILGLEPSCLMTLRDEFGSLLPGRAADAMKARARLLTEYLAERRIEAAMALPGRTLHVHGHCHQKSFGAFPAALTVLRGIKGTSVKPIESSCCGMAGAFGYGAETLDASKAMAELSLLPAVRAAAATDIIVADGTSCRHQIADLAGREALHTVRVLDMALARPALAEDLS
jgi:Fe-S oxidoreductase